MKTRRQARKEKYLKKHLNTFLIELFFILVFTLSIMVNLKF